MHIYSKGNLGPFILVYCNWYVEASIQGYNKGSLGSFILIYYNG
jgi:hypothetical protein